MMHPSENEIELLLLAPEKIVSERRELLVLHFKQCVVCRETAALLQSFHTEFAAHPERSEKATGFAESLLARGTVIELHPFRFVPDSVEFGEHAMTVLAAKSETTNNYRYSAVCTLVSRDERTLVRILRDNETDRYKMYLMTHPRTASLHATVRFPALECNVTIDSETQQAEFSLPKEQSGIDWTNIVADLYIS